jgi:hypothetical protein
MTDDSFRPCLVCGENVVGLDFVSFASARAYLRGEPGNQCYLSRDEDDEKSFDFLHRECVVLWLDGMYVRLNSDVEMRGDE